MRPRSTHPQTPTAGSGVGTERGAAAARGKARGGRRRRGVPRVAAGARIPGAQPRTHDSASARAARPDTARRGGGGGHGPRTRGSGRRGGGGPDVRRRDAAAAGGGRRTTAERTRPRHTTTAGPGREGAGPSPPTDTPGAGRARTPHRRPGGSRLTPTPHPARDAGRALTRHTGPARTTAAGYLERGRRARRGGGDGAPHARRRRPDNRPTRSPPTAARSTRGPRRYRPVTRGPGRAPGRPPHETTTATARRGPHRVPKAGRRPPARARARPSFLLHTPNPPHPPHPGPLPRTHVPGPLLATEGGKGGSDGKRGNERAGGTPGGWGGGRERERARRTTDGGEAPGSEDRPRRTARGRRARSGGPTTGKEPVQGRRREGDGAGERPPPPRGSRRRRHATHPETHRRLRAGNGRERGGRDRRRRRRRAWGGARPPPPGTLGPKPRGTWRGGRAGETRREITTTVAGDAAWWRAGVASGGPTRGTVSTPNPRGRRRGKGRRGGCGEGGEEPPSQPDPFRSTPFSRSPPPPAEGHHRPDDGPPGAAAPPARAHATHAPVRARAPGADLPVASLPPLSSPVPRRTGGERLVREQGGSAAALSEPR
ncbi:collagen alpha-1(I) chain-like [Balaenoptera ricei]|uniref:collagen alpha-1(I) chain-like n=1 Tax=Balaenoptera ricei TaxID=2746895 RepID=UPI0028BF29D3|nr:collagen alpha-1(I) chain-like [Balaenoptera ricei]